MVPIVIHVAIVFMILRTVSVRIVTAPAVIPMATVIISVAIAKRDVPEIDGDTGPCRRGGGDDNRCGKQSRS